MKWFLGIFLFFGLFLKGQTTTQTYTIADFKPYLAPYYRTGTPTLFQLQFKEKLPQTGELKVVLNLNGFLFTNHFVLDDLEKEVLILKLICPYFIKSCQIILQGAINQTIDNVLISENTKLFSNMMLGGIFVKDFEKYQLFQKSLENSSHKLIHLKEEKFKVGQTIEKEFFVFQYFDVFDYIIIDKSSLEFLLSFPKLQNALKTWLSWGGNLYLEDMLFRKNLGSQKLKELLFSGSSFSKIFEDEDSNTLFKWSPKSIRWKQYKVEPTKDIFWEKEIPLLIKFSYGKGNLFFCSNWNDSLEKISKEENLDYKKSILAKLKRNKKGNNAIEVWNPYCFDAFQTSTLLPKTFRGALLLALFIYVLIWMRILWKKQKLISQKWVISIFSLGFLSLYFWVNQSPIFVKELYLQVYYRSPKLVNWQRFVHLGSQHQVFTQFNKRNQSDSQTYKEVKDIGILIPQFYEKRDFHFSSQENLNQEQTLSDKNDKILPKKPYFWNFELSQRQLKRIPLEPGLRLVFEQHGTIPKSSTLFTGSLELSSQYEIQNTTPFELASIVTYDLKKQKWYYFPDAQPNQMSAAKVELDSKKSLLEKFPPIIQRFLEYTFKKYPPESYIYAFPKKQKGLFQPLFGFSSLQQISIFEK